MYTKLLKNLMDSVKIIRKQDCLGRYEYCIVQSYFIQGKEMENAYEGLSEEGLLKTMGEMDFDLAEVRKALKQMSSTGENTAHFGISKTFMFTLFDIFEDGALKYYQ